MTREFSQSGLLGPLIGSAPNPRRLENLLNLRGAEPADPILNLAALCLNLPEDAHRLREKLRLSNPEHQRLVKAADALETLHDLDLPPDENGFWPCCFVMAVAAPAMACCSPRRKRATMPIFGARRSNFCATQKSRDCLSAATTFWRAA